MRLKLLRANIRFLFKTAYLHAYFFRFLISHFRDELNTYQTNFLFREVIA